MEYQVEELVKMTADLMEKYTSKESSSITYETAEMLMQAVIYTIEENFQTKEDPLVSTGTQVDLLHLYKRGRERIGEKVIKAKEYYEELLEGFEDYGCENYKSTILYGMPSFFLRYDEKFQPQNHILMLDYPQMVEKPELSGVDRIDWYLKGILQEKKFMENLSANVIKEVLGMVVPEYETLYMDNICERILQQMVGRVISGHVKESLLLEKEEYERIYAFFKEAAQEEVEGKVAKIIQQIARYMKVDEKYFLQFSEACGFRIYYGCKNHGLEGVFVGVLEEI